MKKFYILFFLTIGLFVNAQIVNIPDANFKTLLLSASPTDVSYQIAQNLSGQYVKIDSNNDGEIQISEAQQIKKLVKYCNSCSESQKIASIEGIQGFVNLTDLQLTYQHLTDINILNDLINLQTINFASNWIENISLPNLTNLTTLNLRNNYISNISLSNYKNLASLSLENNSLTFLNLNDLKFLNQILIANNPNLTHLFFVNHVNNYPFPVSFGTNSNVRFLCVDESDIVSATSTFNSSNSGSSIVINQYCQPFYNGLGLNILTGSVILDYNIDGCDTNDIKFKNTKLKVESLSNTEISYSNGNGIYEFFLNEGNFTITPQLENPSYFTISPTNFTVDFPTQASPFTQDFCVTANGIHHDVEIVLLPTTRARPGFNAIYKLVYHNKGNQVENGTFSLTFDDSRLDFLSTNTVYSSSTLNSFTWDYSNLQPFETREIELAFNVNSPMETPAVNIGDQLDFLAQITPFTNDEVQYDNIFGLKQIVLGALDPNDKTCLQGTTITPSEVGNYVHYVIRFENTGTYPAENIVVKDMIDLTKFDIATLVPLKSSHDFYTRINGDKVEFIFENINLDFNDATNDGYVVFKIKTKPTLVLGDTFTNNANIYFDYNFPITTNTYTTTIAALSTQDFEFGSYFSLYPNPAKEVLNIQAKQGLAINSIEIYNQLGQIVMATTNAINTIDVANLASGTYFVKVNTEKGSANAKFVKE